MRSYKKYDDEELFNLISQDNPLAFEELYGRYYAILLNNAYKRLRDKDQSEEVVQELFVNLWVKRHKIGTPQNSKAYLTTAIRNQVISSIRKNKNLNLTDNIDLPSLPIASTNATEDDVKYEELKAAYEKSILELPEKCRQVYQLHEQGLSVHEIAEQLVVSPKTVEAHILKARNTLRKRLGGFSAVCLIILSYTYL